MPKLCPVLMSIGAETPALCLVQRCSAKGAWEGTGRDGRVARGGSGREGGVGCGVVGGCDGPPPSPSRQPARGQGVCIIWYGPPICRVVRDTIVPLPGRSVSLKIGHQLQIQVQFPGRPPFPTNSAPPPPLPLWTPKSSSTWLGVHI